MKRFARTQSTFRLSFSPENSRHISWKTSEIKHEWTDLIKGTNVSEVNRWTSNFRVPLEECTPTATFRRQHTERKAYCWSNKKYPIITYVFIDQLQMSEQLDRESRVQSQLPLQTAVVSLASREQCKRIPNQGQSNLERYFRNRQYTHILPISNFLLCTRNRRHRRIQDNREYVCCRFNGRINGVFKQWRWYKISLIVIVGSSSSIYSIIKIFKFHLAFQIMLHLFITRKWYGYTPEPVASLC